ncbi:hypothetical protein CFC35_36015 [Streptomyces sp. FBKL.4005]|nr:hypothetical protein CFC35_36015 [Streptomyces sp. FBKL.4005]
MLRMDHRAGEVLDARELRCESGVVVVLQSGAGVRRVRRLPAIALPALLRRFPTLTLAVPETALRFRQGSTVYGVEALPVAW